MAITGYKNIKDNKGYFVDSKDREIFEREISKGYFGMNIGDIIEFVIYDANDNKLPQASANDNLVRYIEYNDGNEQKYFGKSQKNNLNRLQNDSSEFFIDTEKLIREAGYKNGIFKTSISLLNRRLGSEDRENDKVWIHEIAPSRTEIRLLPVIEKETGTPNSDLDERYKGFIEEKNFAADVLPFLNEFIEQFDVQTAIENMLTLNGGVAQGQDYINLIQDEFKIPFDIFVQQVKDRFTKSINNYVQNRGFNILDRSFGLPIKDTPKLTMDADTVLDTAITILGNCIEYSLPKRELQEESALTIEQQETLDKVDNILKTVTSNDKYTSTIPPSIGAKKVGCKNPNAANYDPTADIHDEGLCVFVETKEIQVPKPKPIPKPKPNPVLPKVQVVEPTPPPKPEPIPEPKSPAAFLLNESIEDTIKQLGELDGLDRTGLRDAYDTGDYGPMAAILEELQYEDTAQRNLIPVPPAPSNTFTLRNRDLVMAGNANSVGALIPSPFSPAPVIQIKPQGRVFTSAGEQPRGTLFDTSSLFERKDRF